MENIFRASLSILGTLGIAGVTTLFCAKLQKQRNFKTRSFLPQLVFGIIYGLFSVYATHTAVQYETAFINIRNAGPLVAGIAFGPLSGILAGLIGGFERLLLHTGVTTVPCFVTALLSGAAGAAIGHVIRKRSKPLDPLWGLAIGGSMEILHMLLVLFFSSGTLAKNAAIVQVIAPPMILFGALTVWLCLYICNDRG